MGWARARALATSMAGTCFKNCILKNTNMSYITKLHVPGVVLRPIQKDAHRKTVKFGGGSAPRTLTWTRLVTKTKSCTLGPLPRAELIHGIFNTWFQTPKNEPLPGHADHVLKT